MPFLEIFGVLCGLYLFLFYAFHEPQTPLDHWGRFVGITLLTLEIYSLTNGHSSWTQSIPGL